MKSKSNQVECLRALKSARAIATKPLPFVVCAFKHLYHLVIIILLAWTGQGVLSAATLPAGFFEATVNGPAGATWNQALGMQFEDNGRMYVWEKAGKVWFREYGGSTWTLLIDISEEVGDWEDFGLLGFALDPNFRVNGNIYLMYVVDRHHLINFGTGSYNPASDNYFSATIGRITRYTARAADGFTSVDYTTRHILLGESKTNGFPLTHESHGVGSLVFGEDGTLLASCGDGASWETVDVGSASESYYAQALADGIIRTNENVGAYRAQMVNSLSGKILRIDPATGDGIPSNPFYDAAKPRAAQSRVWALGLRNPYRFTLRPGSGSHNPTNGNPGVLYIGDVGMYIWEDLHVGTGPGQNFGWPAFEGIEAHPGYHGANVRNLDAPNPLYPGAGGAGCSQFFYFTNLIRQNTTVVSNQPPFNNPCNTSQKITNTIPQFLHTLPAFDWKHGTTQARTWIYNSSGVAVATNLDGAGSPVSGSMFSGNCSIGGVWYTGNDFPAQYRNRYYHADHGGNWIKSFVFDANDKPVSVTNFATGGGGIVALATHPIDGGLYYIDINTGGTLRKITYSVNGNLPPTALASANTNYGPGPLLVQFTGSASSDPEGLSLTYNWNFGDGSPVTNSANPSHTFNATPGEPTPYTVSLIVTDNVGQVSTTTLLISVNNTPPTVTITSPTNGSKYAMTSNTIYNLTATVTDVESTDALLKYEWQTFFHHNNHEHLNPVDTNHVTTRVISPVGCDGINIYYYRVQLRVTDPQGLSTFRTVSIFPDCGTPDTPPVISNIPDQTINQGETTGPILFTVSDAETAAVNLQLSGSSSNQTLVPQGNIVFGDNGTNRTVTVSPAAGQSGTATITVTVNDGPNNTSTNFVLTVQSAPLAIMTTTLPNGVVNAAYSATLAATGGLTPYTWSLASGSLSAGLTLNTNTGVIAGTPTTLGTSNFMVRVTDASAPAQTATQALTLTVTIASPSGIIGNTNNGTLTDNIWGSGASINAGRFLAGSNMTVTTIRAQVTAIAGNYKCAIYSDSGGQPSGLLRSTAEVSNPGDGWQTFPLTTSQGLTNGNYYWLAIWSDDANARVYYSASGTLRWGTYAYGAWPDPISTSGGNTLNYCIYAFGEAAPTVPTATSLAVGLLEDTTTNLTLLGQGGQGPLTYAIQTGPTNGTLTGLNPNTGAVSYTPNLNYNGADTFRFTVSDGSQQATGTVSLTITAVNDAPTLALATNNVVVLEDSGAVTVTNFAVTTVGSINESGQSVTNIVVLSVSNATLFAISPAITTNGTLTFTSAANSNGVAVVTVQARDNGGTANGGTNGSVAQSFTITVLPVNDAPTLALATNNVVVLKDSGAVTVTNFAVTTVGPGNETGQSVTNIVVLSVSNATLFAISPVIATNGALTFTSAANSNGVAVVTVQARDNGGTANGGTNGSVAQSFTITVTVSNVAPLVILTTSLPNGTVNVGYVATLTGSGGTTPYTWSLTNSLLPPGLTLNTNTGGISGTPTTIGTSNFIVRVTDASGPAQTATQALSLTVNPAPLSGIIGNTNTGTSSDNIWGSGASINAGRFLAGSNMTVTTMRAQVTNILGRYKCAIYSDSGGLPSQLLRATLEVTNAATGWQTFPLTAAQGLTNGNYYWLAIWSDDANARVYYSDTSGALRWGTYTNYGTWPDPISTSGGNSFKYCIYAFGAAGPTASSLAVGLLEDTTTNLTLLGQGGQGPLTFAILSNPTNGVLGALNPNTGAVSYSPNLNYNGVDTFRFTVSDGSQQATGTVSLTITAVNDAPTLALATNNVVVLEDSGAVTVTNFAVTANGPANESGQSVTNIAVLSVSNATLFAITPAISTNGTLTFTPVANSNGVAAVTVQARDNGGTANGGTNGAPAQTFTITVLPVNDAPVANADNYNLGDGVTLNIAAPGVLTNDTDVEGESLTAVLVSGPWQGVLNLNLDGGFDFTPTNYFNGVDTFTYQVSDSQTNSGPASVNIVVSNQIHISSIALANGMVTVTWSSLVGKNYRLQYKENLTDENWTDLPPDVTATGATATGTNTVDSASQRYYRVSWLGY